MAKSENVKPTIPEDAADIAELFLDPKLGDGITDTHYHSIAVDKPKNFFRLHPDKKFRRRLEIYTHKIEGQIEESHYIIAPSMRGRIPEARPCTLAVVVDRDGTPRLWPLKFPKEGERDNDAWTSARAVAREALAAWVRLIWDKRAYKSRHAEQGFAPDPDWSKVPPYETLIKIAFGEHGVIRDTDHPIYRELFGAAPKKSALTLVDGDDDADSDDADGEGDDL
jgi:hypothetical protein